MKKVKIKDVKKVLKNDCKKRLLMKEIHEEVIMQIKENGLLYGTELWNLIKNFSVKIDKPVGIGHTLIRITSLHDQIKEVK